MKIFFYFNTNFSELLLDNDKQSHTKVHLFQFFYEKKGGFIYKRKRKYNIALETIDVSFIQESPVFFFILSFFLRTNV